MNQKIKLSLYFRLPYFIQKLLFNTKAKQKYNNRVHGEFLSYYNKLRELWTAEMETVSQFQKNELISLLIEAYNYSDWYKKIFEDLQIDLPTIKNEPYGVLRKLQFLTKDDLRGDLEKIVSKNPELGEGIANYTSGTTGSPMKTIACENSENRLHAIKKRFHVTAGVSFENRCVRLSGNQIVSNKRKKPPFWHHNRYENVWFFSLYHITKQNLPHYIKKLNEVKPHLLDGYPSGFYVLANYILNNNITLNFTPDAICTTAEPLTEHVRETIELAFKCKTYNQYSSSEGATFITECDDGNLHINEDTGIAEFFNENGERGMPGEQCELVITGFINKKTPLIRYRTGDWVKLPEQDEKCSCGCNMPIIDEIFGRFEDYLIDQNGVEQGMVSYRTFKNADNIIKAQVIQESKVRVIIKLVRDDGYTHRDEEFVRTKIKDVLGESLNLHFDYVQDIEPGPNGKFKSVIKNF